MTNSSTPGMGTREGQEQLQKGGDTEMDMDDVCLVPSEADPERKI